jgi:murein L,D-transpeptidase YafK
MAVAACCVVCFPHVRCQGPLYNKVVVEDSVWTLEDGCTISVALEKDNRMEWWKCVIKGDAEIDTTKVQPENSKLDDLDADTRKTVEKMMVSANLGQV